jgi:hypothetical protein
MFDATREQSEAELSAEIASYPEAVDEVGQLRDEPELAVREGGGQRARLAVLNYRGLVGRR